MYKLQQIYSTFKKPPKNNKNKQKITKQTFKKKRTKQNKNLEKYQSHKKQRNQIQL